MDQSPNMTRQNENINGNGTENDSEDDIKDNIENDDDNNHSILCWKQCS
jgi:hypothetical protein